MRFEICYGLLVYTGLGNTDLLGRIILDWKVDGDDMAAVHGSTGGFSVEMATM